MRVKLDKESNMNTLRWLLAFCGLIAAGLGAVILIAPVSFHASYGTELAGDASLLSEIRAPGGALLALGVMMLIGTLRKSFTRTAASVAATVYLAYGGSRLLSFGLDGWPDQGLVIAAGLEIILGGACVVALIGEKRMASEPR